MRARLFILIMGLTSLPACAEVPEFAATADDVGQAENSCQGPEAGFGCGPENIEGPVVIVEPVPFDPVTEDRVDALSDPELTQMTAEIWVATGCVETDANEEALQEARLQALADRLGLTDAQRSGDSNRYLLENAVIRGENLLIDAGRINWDEQRTWLEPCST